jgi:hypothetical protein
MKRTWAVPIILGALMALTMPARTAHSDDGLAQLAAQFVQWQLSIPQPLDRNKNPVAPFNPGFDPSGDYCMVGQRGPVWFLSGIPFGGTATRNCTVPEGTTLFFPVINGFAFNTPNCGQTGDINTVKGLKNFYYGYLAGFVKQVQNKSATLNGRDLPIQLVESVPFSVAYPPDGIFGPDACSAGVALLPGIYSPGLTDGYWVELDNLKASPTPYTLHFGAQSFFPGNVPIVQDITYHLTVAQVYLK